MHVTDGHRLSRHLWRENWRTVLDCIHLCQARSEHCRKHCINYYLGNSPIFEARILCQTKVGYLTWLAPVIQTTLSSKAFFPGCLFDNSLRSASALQHWRTYQPQEFCLTNNSAWLRQYCSLHIVPFAAATLCTIYKGQAAYKLPNCRYVNLEHIAIRKDLWCIFTW